MKLEICIDVDDVDRAVKFYGQGLGLTVLKYEKDWAQLQLEKQTFWLMKVDARTARLDFPRLPSPLDARASRFPR
jgi:catechol 2,3-dioxygenase-like lactoylglutathione lyase family enzyme